MSFMLKILNVKIRNAIELAQFVFQVIRIEFLYLNPYLHSGAELTLNLFSLAMNPPSNQLEKVELLLDFAFKNSKTLHYRDFYGVK